MGKKNPAQEAKAVKKSIGRNKNNSLLPVERYMENPLRSFEDSARGGFIPDPANLKRMRPATRRRLNEKGSPMVEQGSFTTLVTPQTESGRGLFLVESGIGMT